MTSKRTIEWREKNRDAVTQWRNSIAELRKVANLENWAYERLEIEIAQRLPSKLREIFDFTTSYTRRYKSGKFRKYMDEAASEIIEYGTLEPSRYYTLIKNISIVKEKMHGKK